MLFTTKDLSIFWRWDIFYSFCYENKGRILLYYSYMGICHWMGLVLAPFLYKMGCLFYLLMEFRI